MLVKLAIYHSKITRYQVLEIMTVLAVLKLFGQIIGIYPEPSEPSNLFNEKTKYQYYVGIFALVLNRRLGPFGGS